MGKYDAPPARQQLYRAWEYFPRKIRYSAARHRLYRAWPYFPRKIRCSAGSSSIISCVGIFPSENTMFRRFVYNYTARWNISLGKYDAPPVRQQLYLAWEYFPRKIGCSAGSSTIIPSVGIFPSEDTMRRRLSTIIPQVGIFPSENTMFRRLGNYIAWGLFPLKNTILRRIVNYIAWGIFPSENTMLCFLNEVDSELVPPDRQLYRAWEYFPLFYSALFPSCGWRVMLASVSLIGLWQFLWNFSIGKSLKFSVHCEEMYYIDLFSYLNDIRFI